MMFIERRFIGRQYIDKNQSLMNYYCKTPNILMSDMLIILKNLLLDFDIQIIFSVFIVKIPGGEQPVICEPAGGQGDF